MGGRLQGKVALITGGTSGIGERTAERFVSEGARILIAARSEDKGRRLVERLGEATVFQRADVSSEEDVKAATDMTVRRFGRLDCVFNNAASSIILGGIESVTREAFRHDFDVLVGGTLWGMKHAVPVMKRQQSGCIINTASIGGMSAGFSGLLYGAAKAAVIQLTKQAAMELAKDHIRVNVISPGFIVTPMFARLRGLDEEQQKATLGELEHAVADMLPLGIAGLPDDIASAAVYLASEEARYVTGHNLVVDAGLSTGLSPEASAALYNRIETAIGLHKP